MDTKKKHTANAPITVLLILVMGLCVAEIVLTAVRQRTAIPTMREVLVYVGYILVLAYALAGYRVPHGNLLKYTMLVFASLLVVTLVVNPAFYGGTEKQVNEAPDAQLALSEGEGLTEPPADMPLPPSGEPDAPEMENPITPGEQKRINLMELIFLGTTMILISYMAGRLDRIKENRIIIVLVLVLLLARAFLVNYGMRMAPVGLNEFIMWLVLSCSYLFRYREHKEAGMQDRNQLTEKSDQ